MVSCVALSWLSLAVGVNTKACILPTQYLGLTWPPTATEQPRIELARRRIAPFLRRGLPTVDRQTAVAVFVLGHELGHAHGIDGERAADRYALDHWTGTVLALDGTRATARRLRVMLGGTTSSGGGTPQLGRDVR